MRVAPTTRVWFLREERRKREKKKHLTTNSNLGKGDSRVGHHAREESSRCDAGFRTRLLRDGCRGSLRRRGRAHTVFEHAHGSYAQTSCVAEEHHANTFTELQSSEPLTWAACTCRQEVNERDRSQSGYVPYSEAHFFKRAHFLTAAHFSVQT